MFFQFCEGCLCDLRRIVLEDSLIRSQPFLVRVGMNVYAFVADTFVLLVSLPLCRLLEKPAARLMGRE